MNVIDHPEKIGIGTWDKDSLGTALNDVGRGGFAWYYNWSGQALWDADLTPDRASFVAMARCRQDVTVQALANLVSSGSNTLLGFNEPDNIHQANMSVSQSIGLWSRLEATGMRLGSPAPSQQEALGDNSWLGRFMAKAEEESLRVDFIQLHYYSDDKDVGAFKAWLKEAYEQYHKPIWVTEWGLADWDHPNRFSAAEQAAFANAGSHMMDDLAFVKRQAWFAAYDGGGGWDINSGLFNEDGTLTSVGRIFARLTNPPSGTDPAIDPRGTGGDDLLIGGAAAETLLGLRGDDRILAGANDDHLQGGLGRDILKGEAGADTFDFTSVRESTVGAQRDIVYFSHAQGDNIDLVGMDADRHVTGDQAFAWVDRDHLNAAFTGVEGQLRFAGGVLSGDTDGDRMADFHIRIVGSLAGTDVIL